MCCKVSAGRWMLGGESGGECWEASVKGKAFLKRKVFLKASVKGKVFF